MDQNKLFVVILVIALIFIGLFIHLLVLDKKLRNLEKKITNKTENTKELRK
jgi:cell division protein FtsL